MAAETLGDGEGSGLRGDSLAGECLAVVVAEGGENEANKAGSAEGMAEVAFAGEDVRGRATDGANGGKFVGIVGGAGGVGVDEGGFGIGDGCGETVAERYGVVISGDEMCAVAAEPGRFEEGQRFVRRFGFEDDCRRCFAEEKTAAFVGEGFAPTIARVIQRGEHTEAGNAGFKEWMERGIGGDDDGPFDFASPDRLRGLMQREKSRRAGGDRRVYVRDAELIAEDRTHRADAEHDLPGGVFGVIVSSAQFVESAEHGDRRTFAGAAEKCSTVCKIRWRFEDDALRDTAGETDRAIPREVAAKEFFRDIAVWPFNPAVLANRLPGVELPSVGGRECHRAA